MSDGEGVPLRVGPRHALTPTEPLAATAADGREVAVFDVDGEPRAYAGRCLHRGGRLAGGYVRDAIVTCPEHWWRYDLRTGRLVGQPAVRLEAYPIRLAGEELVVTLPPLPAAPSTLRERLLALARAASGQPDGPGPTAGAHGAVADRVEHVERGAPGTLEDGGAAGGGRARPIRGVIWDMGGILHPTPFEVLPEIERARALDPGTYPRGPFDPAGDADYEALQRGEIREPEYWRRQQARLAERGIELDVHRTIDWSGRDRPEVVAAIRRLGGRYRQAILTNDATTWLGPGWRARWWLRDEFAALVDAADEGVRKPDPAIYLRCADALGVPPPACLFVDDLMVNVDGARAVGMEAFWFDVTDAAGSVRRLLDRLDSPNS